MHKFLSGLLAGVALLIAAPNALAAPVTVDLRIEGPTRTLFEGPVTTDLRAFQFTGDPVAHRCDGTAVENHGTSPAPVPTRGAAVAAAAAQVPFAIHGAWFDSLGSPSFNDIDGENVAFDPGTNRFLAEYKNAQSASVGSCGDPIGPGDRVLFAYNDGDDPLLALAGPGSAKPGETATVKVTDAASGAAIAGATVGGKTTAADGTATVGPFTARGEQDLKASKPGTVRSNRLRVCVSDGHDGSCDTTTPGATPAPGSAPAARDTTAPIATIASPRKGAVYSRRRAPRLLRGSVTADQSGLKSVKLKLTRRAGRRCSYFSGSRERFQRISCGHGWFLPVGESPDWSYLLPKRLGRGRYLLEVLVTDRAHNRGTPARVRFRVK
jgi:hypothetical protein